MPTPNPPDRPERPSIPPASTFASGRPPPLLVVNPNARANRLKASATEAVLACLAQVGLVPEVCGERDLAEAQAHISAAVRAGCELVIAAGGDGTIEAIVPTLIGTGCRLGILPLGTYNNVAASLDIPFELQAACALIGSALAATSGSALVRGVDVGQVRAEGSDATYAFVEQASIGLGPLLAPVGESFEKGRWWDALRALPAAMRLAPLPIALVLDGGRERWDVSTLLVTISNTPRSAASFVLAPEARLDDGLLDVCVYEGLHQAELAAQVIAFMTSGVHVPGVRRARAALVEVSSIATLETGPLLIAADVDVVGSLPARVSVVPGGLQVIAPPGRGAA